MTYKDIFKKLTFYIFATILAALMILPFFWMISTSLKERGALMAIPIQWFPEKITFNSYTRVFKVFPFARSMLNSIYVAIMTTFLSVTSSAMAAYVFAKIPFKGRDKIFVLYLATMMIPTQVTMIPNFIVLKYMGLLNTFTGLMLPFLFNAFGTFMLRQYMKGISDSYIEAAIIDGATQFTIFRKVIIPLSKPALATLTVLTFMTSWNAYLWPLIILTDKAKMTLPVGLNLLNGQYNTQYNLLMAGGLLSILPILVVYLLAQRYFEEGLSFGGVKG